MLTGCDLSRPGSWRPNSTSQRQDLFVPQPLRSGETSARASGMWQAQSGTPPVAASSRSCWTPPRAADAGGAEQDPFRVGAHPRDSAPGATSDAAPRRPRVDHVDVGFFFPYWHAEGDSYRREKNEDGFRAREARETLRVATAAAGHQMSPAYANAICVLITVGCRSSRGPVRTRGWGNRANQGRCSIPHCIHQVELPLC